LQLQDPQQRWKWPQRSGGRAASVAEGQGRKKPWANADFRSSTVSGCFRPQFLNWLETSNMFDLQR